MAKSISLTTPYCKVTGRRHRVSPCRSAYFASPWWLLTLDLVDVVEKQLYYSQSRDGIWRCGSRPSLFMIIPNTKRHPNNTKTDQLLISEVITGLPRPYHNSLSNRMHIVLNIKAGLRPVPANIICRRPSSLLTQHLRAYWGTIGHALLFSIHMLSIL